MKPCGPGFQMETFSTRRRHDRDPRTHEHRERHGQDVEHDELDLGGLDLLAEVLRRAPDHQAGDEDGEEREFRNQERNRCLSGGPNDNGEDIMAKYMLVSFKTCPWVQRAAIVLREKGIEFEFRHIDRDNRPDWFLAISPHKKVPVVRIDDKVSLFSRMRSTNTSTRRSRTAAAPGRPRAACDQPRLDRLPADLLRDGYRAAPMRRTKRNTKRTSPRSRRRSRSSRAR